MLFSLHVLQENIIAVVNSDSYRIWAEKTIVVEVKSRNDQSMSNNLNHYVFGPLEHEHTTKNLLRQLKCLLLDIGRNGFENYDLFISTEYLIDLFSKCDLAAHTQKVVYTPEL